MTVDDLIAIRLRTWFPTIDIGTAVDIAKVRKDLEAFAAETSAKLLEEGQKTRGTLLAELEKLPRYEPELRRTLSPDAAEAGFRALDVLRGAETEDVTPEVLAEAMSAIDRLRDAKYEAAMRAVPAGESASFVAIQSIREVLAQ